jgi:hypothetical protein
VKRRAGRKEKPHQDNGKKPKCPKFHRNQAAALPRSLRAWTEAFICAHSYPANLFDLFDLKIGINGFNPIVLRTDCHSRLVTMSIFRLFQIGLPLSGMVGTSVANTGRPANDERNLGLAIAERQWFDAINCDRRGINPIVVLDNWRFQ